jgi:hypothetical protein
LVIKTVYPGRMLYLWLMTPTARIFWACGEVFARSIDEIFKSIKSMD